VVPERQHVCAGGEQPLCQPRRQAGPVGRILGVDDAEADGVLLAQPAEALLDGLAPGGAEDVGDEEDSQGRDSVAG
jgi:hypothetical protein